MPPARVAYARLFRYEKQAAVVFVDLAGFIQCEGGSNKPGCQRKAACSALHFPTHAACHNAWHGTRSELTLLYGVETNNVLAFLAKCEGTATLKRTVSGRLNLAFQKRQIAWCGIKCCL